MRRVASAPSSHLRAALVAGALALLLPCAAAAQYSGNNLLGDVGLRSGTLPGPGRYVGTYVPWRHVNIIKGPGGETISGRGTMDVGGVFPTVQVVFGGTWLGANPGISAIVPFVNNSIDAPTLGVNQGSFGVGDIYVQPLVLGWHGTRADALAGYAFTAPTGRYAPDGDDNVGLGMWAHELSAGTTVYLDQARRWHAAATAFYELHSKKRDTDLRVGNILTIEGGLGATLPDGPSVGLAYVAQWKVTDDSGSAVPAAVRGHKNRLYALGPEIDLLKGTVVLRYLFEVGGRTTLQGGSFVASVVVPF